MAPLPCPREQGRRQRSMGMHQEGKGHKEENGAIEKRGKRRKEWEKRGSSSHSAGQQYEGWRRHHTVLCTGYSVSPPEFTHINIPGSFCPFVSHSVFTSFKPCGTLHLVSSSSFSRVLFNNHVLLISPLPILGVSSSAV